MSNISRSNDIQELIKIRNQCKDEYLKTLIDFLKWTTTFSLAAIIWVANTYGKTGDLDIFLIFSLFFLILSLLIAIITVYVIVRRLGWSWEFLEESCEIVLSTITARDISKFEELDLSKLERTKKQEDYNFFNTHVLGHLITLVIGVLFYVFAIVFSNFNSL